jgi:catalase
VLDAVVGAVKGAGAMPLVIAPRVGGALLKGGAKREADAQLAGSPSVLFDAVALVLSEEGASAVSGEAGAVQFVMDAFGHLKAIGHTPGAKALLDKAGVAPDAGVVGLDGEGFVKAAAKRFFDREPLVRSAP